MSQKLVEAMIKKKHNVSKHNAIKILRFDEVFELTLTMSKEPACLTFYYNFNPMCFIVPGHLSFSSSQLALLKVEYSFEKCIIITILLSQLKTPKTEIKCY